jgi:F-type H+-transporting ATPase subunit b
MKRPFKRRNTGLLVALALTAILAGVAGGAGASSGGEAAPKGWTATDTYRVMNFAVLALGLFLLLRKPVSQALASRIKGIKEQLSDLEARKKEAESELAAYEKRLTELDREAEKIIAEYVKAGQEAKDRILKEAESAAGKLEAQARRNIEHEFSQAKIKLQQEIMEKAIAKAEGIIRQQMTPQYHERLVDDYLRKVVAR